MLPDDTYVMSQEQMGRACDVSKTSVIRFLKSDELKTLLGKTPSVVRFKFHDTECSGNLNRTINAHTLDIALLFWMSQSEKGNHKGRALVHACAWETLEQRYDRIFKVRKTELNSVKKTLVRVSEYFVLTS